MVYKTNYYTVQLNSTFYIYIPLW